MSPGTRFFTTGHAMALGLFLHLSVAAWNAFWGPSYGSEPDAAGFHANAVAFAAGRWLGDFQLVNTYTYALGFVYRWTVSSLFLGCCLSCVAWLGSALVLTRMMRLLALPDDHQVWAMLLYALFPSTLLMTSVTLREAYQLLAVNCVVYLALRMYSARRMEARLLVALALGIALMGTLQTALLLAGLSIVAMISLVMLFDKRDSYALLKVILALLGFAVVGYFGSSMLLQKVFNSNVDWAASVQLRQESWQQSSRAAYSVGMRITSNFDLMLFIPLALFHYLFEPMPWKLATLSDTALLLENLIRALLLGFVVAGFVMKAFGERQRVALVFLSYLVIETIWAVGTINWGTAARHHIPAFGLLLLAAFAFSAKSAPLTHDLLNKGQNKEGNAIHGSN